MVDTGDTRGALPPPEAMNFTPCPVEQERVSPGAPWPSVCPESLVKYNVEHGFLFGFGLLLLGFLFLFLSLSLSLFFFFFLIITILQKKKLKGSCVSAFEC